MQEICYLCGKYCNMIVASPPKLRIYDRYTPVRIEIDKYTWHVLHKYANTDAMCITRNSHLASPAKWLLVAGDTHAFGQSLKHSEYWVTIQTSQQTAGRLLSDEPLLAALQEMLKYHATQWLIGFVSCMVLNGSTITAAVRKWQDYIGIDDDVRDSYTLMQTFQRYRPK